MRSPLSSGALLADEVGLGKTIEAGIVLCEYWAERRRRLLVIVPASIRKQWALEFTEPGPTCPTCSDPVSPGAKFCAGCGAALSDATKSCRCGAESCPTPLSAGLRVTPVN